MREGASNAIYRCKIHGDFVMPTEDGVAHRFENCPYIYVQSLTTCGMRCEMTTLPELIDGKKEPEIRGLTPEVTRELIETVRRLKTDMGDDFARNRFITQEQLDKTKNVMTLEARLKEAREEMQAAMERPFEF